MSPKATRDDVLDYLKIHHKTLKRSYSLESIALIGSMARGDYTDRSDVDFIVRFQPDTVSIYDKKMGLISRLEEAFGRPIQIASEKYLKPFYRAEILSEAIYV